ncbi:MAG: T9SS type A sorting domain-containing protein [Bacteroidota bacterium]
MSAQCDGRRTDINSLSSAQRAELRDLIMDYLNVGFNPAAPGVNRYPNVAVHSINPGNFLNYMEEFLTWHRAYVRGLEEYLQSRGFTQYVPLPKWDPTNQIPNEFFNGSAILTPSSIFPPLADQDPNNNSNFFYNFTAFTDDVSLCNFPDANILSAPLQSEYDQVNAAIGGSMANAATAPGTAIYWLWQAWIDDIYYCHQEVCQNLSSDVWSADDANDVSNEPYPKSVMWVSDDIWVRNSNDGFQNQTHESPEFVSGNPVYVYLKVRNDGDMPNEDGVGTANLYWAKASTNLSWVFPWTGGNFPSPINLPAGGPIGSQPLRSINEDYADVFDINQNGNTTEIIQDFTIYEFEWFPPNPDDYEPFVNQIGNGSHEHFCLLARIEEPGGMAFPETGSLGSNVNNNDNIVWKNISLKNDIEGLIGGGDDPDCVFVGNFEKRAMENAGFFVSFPSERDAALLELAEINVSASRGLNTMIRRGRTEGLTANRDGSFRIDRREASINGLLFQPQQVEAVCIQVVPQVTQAEGAFNFDLVQTVNGEVVGGERYTVTIGGRPRVISERSDEQEDNTVIRQAIEEVVSIFPNPAFNELNIRSMEYGRKQVRIFNQSGKLMRTLTFDRLNTTIDISELQAGFYLVEVASEVSDKVTTLKLIVK